MQWLLFAARKVKMNEVSLLVTDILSVTLSVMDEGVRDEQGYIEIRQGNLKDIRYEL